MRLGCQGLVRNSFSLNFNVYMDVYGNGARRVWKVQS
jgi:hypothetical protein